MTEENGKRVEGLRVFPYPNRDRAAITVCRVTEPYGPGSGEVVSVGCTLKGKPEEPSWVVHVPVELASEVGDAIKSAADKRSSQASQYRVLATTGDSTQSRTFNSITDAVSFVVGSVPRGVDPWATHQIEEVK